MDKLIINRSSYRNDFHWNFSCDESIWILYTYLVFSFQYRFLGVGISEVKGFYNLTYCIYGVAL